MAISVQFSVSRDDHEIVGDIFECDDIEQAIEALREAAATLEAEESTDPREKGDDDGVEYDDPRDERDGRRAR
jgi:hypothetical protein